MKPTKRTHLSLSGQAISPLTATPFHRAPRAGTPLRGPLRSPTIAPFR